MQLPENLHIELHLKNCYMTFGDGTNGNIPVAGANITCTYQSQQAGFVDYYDAMKAVADEIGMDIEI